MYVCMYVYFSEHTDHSTQLRIRKKIEKKDEKKESKKCKKKKDMQMRRVGRDMLSYSTYPHRKFLNPLNSVSSFILKARKD